MYIRRFAPADADAVVRVSALATRITSGAVYDAAFVEEMVAKQDRAYFLTRGEQMHFYVACEDDGTVIGCAAFGPYHKNPAEGCFYSVFVLPEKQRRGVGRALIETIEHDPMFFSAPRVSTCSPENSTLAAFGVVSIPPWTGSASRYPARSRSSIHSRICVLGNVDISP